MQSFIIKLADLVNGVSVTLPDGTIVTPEQVCTVAKPGPIFFVIHVPSVQYIPSLLMHFQALKDSSREPQCIFHMSHASVMDSLDYQLFMSWFPNAHHIVISNEYCDRRILFKSSSLLQSKLSMLNQSVYPPTNWCHSTKRLALGKISFHADEPSDMYPPKTCVALPMMRVNLEPLLELNLDQVSTSLNCEEDFISWKSLETSQSFLNCIKDGKVASHTRKNSVDSANPSDGNSNLTNFIDAHNCSPAATIDRQFWQNLQVFFTGTGSMLPSKYRNGILMAFMVMC